MRKKTVWLMLGCLMVVALVLASCGPEVTEEEEEVITEEEEAITEEEVVVTEEKEMVRDSLGRLVEKPRYGGVLNLTLSSDIRMFDGVKQLNTQYSTMNLTNEDLLIGDITKGPRGTGEASWTGSSFFDFGMSTGCLAESWEINDDETVIIYHIRKGVHWHDKPPVNGREMTADDVVSSIKRVFEMPLAYIGKGIGERPISVTAVDKYTVELKANPGELGTIVSRISDGMWILPPEMVELHGDMSKWEHSCGTGPFELMDFVPGASAMLVRNPYYWGTDPFHPQNTLPYLDSVKFLIIVDASTRVAAMRTGKTDFLTVDWEQARELRETMPNLTQKGILYQANDVIGAKVDKPELPFHDIRVRHALSMALDRQAIADYLYGGEAAILTHPVTPISEFMDVYTPLDQLPQNIREIYEYHPDKAKKLLVEAGYPDGFKTEIVCLAHMTDVLAVYKDYWSKIGVDLKIEVKELGAYMSLLYMRKHNEMIHVTQGIYNPFRLQHYDPAALTNLSMNNDPRIIEARKTIFANYFDAPKKKQVLREITPYILEQCYYFTPPLRKVYHVWQPWLKGFEGETCIGLYNNWKWAMYAQLDVELKQELVR